MLQLVGLLIEAVQRFGFPRSAARRVRFLRSLGSEAMAAQRRSLVESLQVRLPGIASRSPVICCGVGCFCHARVMIENRNNFQRAGPLARLMYYTRGSWLDFPSRVVESVRPSFVQRLPVVDLAIDGSRYLFDFLRMLQTDFESGSQRSIAWMDEAGSCFFPKCFMEEPGESSIKRKREDHKEEVDHEEEDEASSSNEKQEKKQFFGPNGTNLEKSLWPNARLLAECEGSYLRIKNCFSSAMKSIGSDAVITAIHQCEWRGDMRRARFQVFQKQAEIIKALRGSPNTVYAWHGASSKNVDSILAHGFTAPGSINGSGNYGVGLYFSSVGSPHLR